MVRELLIAGVHDPLDITPVGLMGRGRRVIRHHDLRHPAEELERGHVRVEPRRGLHIRICAAQQRPRERQHRDEQYRPNHLTTDSVNDVHRVTDPIHEHRPPGLVAQHRDQVVGAEIVGEKKVNANSHTSCRRLWRRRSDATPIAT